MRKKKLIKKLIKKLKKKGNKNLWYKLKRRDPRRILKAIKKTAFSHKHAWKKGWMVFSAKELDEENKKLNQWWKIKGISFSNLSKQNFGSAFWNIFFTSVWKGRLKKKF